MRFNIKTPAALVAVFALFQVSLADDAHGKAIPSYEKKSMSLETMTHGYGCGCSGCCSVVSDIDKT